MQCISPNQTCNRNRSASFQDAVTHSNRFTSQTFRQTMTLFVVAFVFILFAPLTSILAHPYSQSEAQTKVDEVRNQPLQAPGSLSGRVTDEMGNPLADITVHLFPNDGSSAERVVTTANDGTYRIDFIGAGLYRLGFADGTSKFVETFYPDVDFLDQAEAVFVASNDVQVTDVQLARGSAIRGTIRTTGGQPLTRLLIKLHQRNDLGTESELKYTRSLNPTIITPTNTITYTFDGLAESLYRICASANISTTGRHIQNCYGQTGADVNDAEDISVTVGITVSNIDINIAAPQTGIISGTVRSPTGEPLPSVWVTSFISRTQDGWQPISMSTLTNEAGQYKFQGLDAGIYTLQFMSANTLATQLLGNVLMLENAEQITLAANERLADVDFVFLDPPMVSGRVTSDIGEPLPNITVVAFMSTANSGSEPANFSSAKSVTTGEDGDYELALQQPGLYTLRFSNSADQFIDEFLGNAPTAETASKFSVQLGDAKTGMDFIARKGATVTGTVTLEDRLFSRRFSAQAHRLVGDEWVEQTAATFETDDGKFRLGGLLPGRYKFAIVASFYDIQLYQCYGSKSFETATEVELEIGSEIPDIDVDLETNVFDGVLGGRITDQDDPVEGILVAIDRKPDGRHLPTMELLTDADGRFRVEGVTPGSYCIRFSDPKKIYATDAFGNHPFGGTCSRVRLEAGEVREDINHSLTEGATIKGHVRDYNGALTGEMEVTAFVYSFLTSEWIDIGVSTVADENGDYVLAGLHPHSYRLRFRTIDKQGADLSTSEYFGGTHYVENGNNVTVQSGNIIENVDYLFGAIAKLEPMIFAPVVEMRR